MEENKRLLNSLSKKTLAAKMKPANDNDELSNAFRGFKTTMQDAVFENLSLGQNEWVNIQTVIRSALKVLHQALIQQSECILTVANNSASKASEEELKDALFAKADAEETKRLFAFLTEKLQTKAEVKDLENLENLFASKASLIDLQKQQSRKIFEVETSILSRVAAKDFDVQRDATNAELLALKTHMKKLESEVESLRGKLNSHETRNESCDRRVKHSETILKDLKPILKNCVSKTEFSDALKTKVEIVR